MLFNIIHANYQCIYILIIKGIMHMRCMQKTELSRKIRLKFHIFFFQSKGL